MIDAIGPYSPHLVIRFFGAPTLASVNRMLADHAAAGQHEVHVFADRTLSDQIQATEHASYIEGNKIARWRILSWSVDDWSDKETLKNGYFGAIHADHDELIFQQEPANSPMMHQAWETGHRVTCGVIAPDVQTFADLVKKLIENWPNPFAASDVPRVLGSFEGQDVSSLVQSRIRSSETIKFWYPTEVTVTN